MINDHDIQRLPYHLYLIDIDTNPKMKGQKWPAFNDRILKSLHIFDIILQISHLFSPFANSMFHKMLSFGLNNRLKKNVRSVIAKEFYIVCFIAAKKYHSALMLLIVL